MSWESNSVVYICRIWVEKGQQCSLLCIICIWVEKATVFMDTWKSCASLDQIWQSCLLCTPPITHSSHLFGMGVWCDSPHQWVHTQERLSHQWAPESYETSSAPVYHSVWGEHTPYSYCVATLYMYIYLWKPLWEETVAVDFNQLTICIPEEDPRKSENDEVFDMTVAHLGDSLMLSFWASALHSDVLPVPGGPSVHVMYSYCTPATAHIGIPYLHYCSVHVHPHHAVEWPYSTISRCSPLLYMCG